MKIQSVTYDSDEVPEFVTFQMTPEEAGLIYALTGCTPNSDVSAALGEKWGRIQSEVASCLSGSFFNVHYDEGASAVVPTGRLHVEKAP